jgi:hypothetical protein
MMRTPARTNLTLTIVTVVFAVIGLLVPVPASAGKAAPTAASGAVFIENAGQFAPQARFLAQTPQGRFWVADDGIWFVAAQPPALTAEELALPLRTRQRLIRQRTVQAAAVRLSFAGAQFAGRIEPFGRLDTPVSFLHGSDPAGWKTAVPSWAGVRVRDLYPGIDLVLGADLTGKLPWRLEAGAGANLEGVRLVVTGASDVAVIDGHIKAQAGAASFTFALPALTGAKAPAVPALAASAAGGDVEIASPFGPAAEAPDGTADLKWATFIGGDGLDWGRSIAVDSSGNSYVAGDTASLNFPVTSGVYDLNGDGSEAFVAKLSASGASLLYATYIGGSGFDYGWGVATANNIAYLVGDTDWLDFPGTGLADPAGQNDIYVLALNANGTATNFVKFIGGTEQDYGYAITFDGTNLFIAGSTLSPDLGTQLSGPRGEEDALVAKLSTSGVVSYIAQAGGSAKDAAYAIRVRSNEAYAAGETASSDFPGGAKIAGGSDALVFKLTSAGAMSSSTALGDTLLATPAYDFAQAMAIDSAGAVYVGGGTSSTAFPRTSGTPGFAGGLRDAFVSKLTLSGTTWSLPFSILIGGSGLEDAYGVAVDSNGGIYATGETDSTNMPTTANGYDTAASGPSDAFLVRLHPSSPNANRLTYGTYLGGSGGDGGYALAIDSSGNALIAGATDSANFPVTSGAYDTSPDPFGAPDAFLAKLLVPVVPASPILSIAKSGNDASLSWTQVTTDIIGAPMTVSSYRLWRSLKPYFAPGDTSSPSPLYSGTNRAYTDAGVLANLNNYFYVVNAVGPNSELSPDSNRMGEFTFSLVKGQ